MKIMYERNRTTTVLTGLASLVCGIVVFANPTGVALSLTSVVGWALAAVGAISLVGYVRGSAPTTQLGFFLGLAALVFGMVLAIWPSLFVSWIIVIIGIFILFSGIGDFAAAGAWSAVGAPFGTAATALTVLKIVFGVLVVVSPFTLVDLTLTIAGIGLVFNGVTELLAAVKE